MLKLFKILLSLTRALNRLAAAQEAIALQAQPPAQQPPAQPAQPATFHQTTPTSIWAKTNYE